MNELIRSLIVYAKLHYKASINAINGHHQGGISGNYLTYKASKKIKRLYLEQHQAK